MMTLPPNTEIAMPSSPTVFRTVVLLSAVAALGDVTSGDDQRDFETLRSQLVEYFAESAPDESVIKRYVATLRPDGSWPDVDYASRQLGGWRTYSHMVRVLDLARAYRRDQHPVGNSAGVREATVRALDHWLEQDYRVSNWWYGRIGIPRLVAPTLILMDDDLPPETRAQTIDQILNRSQMGLTAQNKVWCAGIAFMKGLLIEDFPLMHKARDAILSELRITTSEGVQPDFSFHQHGPQQQWGNYGRSFGHDMLQWSTVFRDTRFAPSAEQWNILCDYLTEGPAWIVWRGQMDISGCGRQLSPGCQSSKGRSLLGQLRDLEKLDPSQAGKVDRILNSRYSSGDNLLVGHKHYWRSDIAVHRRPNWYASVKMSSTRVIGAENDNSENMLGLHLGDGVTYFLRTGREYQDLFPLWDWRRLPGTTCRQDDGSLAPNSSRCRGGSDFVGGVTDGRRGVSVLEYRRHGLRANKSWFFLDDAVVCLGAGVTCDGLDEVVTSIEQAMMNGPVVISEAGETRHLDKGKWSLKEPEWIHHTGIGYCLLHPQQVQVECAEKQGDWQRVNGQARGSRTARGDVFSLWISHGDSPQHAAYAYSVHPDTSIEKMPERYAQSKASLIQNTEAIQAISLGKMKIVMAVFSQPGRLSLDGGGYVEVDIPCALIIDRTSGALSCYVADPTHRAEAVDVRISEFGNDETSVTLPQEGLAGSTTLCVEF